MQIYAALLIGSLLASLVSSQEQITLIKPAEASQLAQRASTSEDDNLASLHAASSSAALTQAAARKLGVCVVTADFWGILKFPQDSGRGVRATLKGGGGTATAYHLLATLLRQQPDLKVTFLGASKDMETCTQAQKVHKASGLDFECLQERHFEAPKVVETYPYEALSHAVAAWVRENADLCQVIHGHEWGGVLVDAATVVYFRRLRQGARSVVTPHGGHMWSMQWKPQRSFSVEPLRIDHQERMVNLMADTMASPTAYMQAYFRQRGWQLPEDTLTIPNVMPAFPEQPSTPHALGNVRRVWRVAFFSRLEERKGIKVFVDALHKLDFAALSRSQAANSRLWKGGDRVNGTAGLQQLAEGSSGSQEGRQLLASAAEEFEVYFLGADTTINYQPSSTWLAEQARFWPWRSHLLMNAPRSEALSVLSMEGMMVVFCSLVENMPYVVAEVAALGTPYMVSDVGGMSELVELERYSEAVVPGGDYAELAVSLQTVLERGALPVLPLRQEALDGGKRWLQWHEQFLSQQNSLKKADMKLLLFLPAAQAHPLQVIDVAPGHDAAAVWSAACKRTESRMDFAAPLLLLPEGYSLLPGDKVQQDMLELLLTAEDRGGIIGALTFGVELPSGWQAFPSSPTWLLHDSGDAARRCYSNVPVLIRANTFCKVADANAHLIRSYDAWVIALLLSRAGMYMHTYPQAFFSVREWEPALGYEPCVSTRVPDQRRADYGMTSAMLFTDAAQTLHGQQIGIFGRPLASLNADYPTHQRHGGWQFGYVTGPDSRDLQQMTWRKEEGRWACATGPEEFPSMRPGGMHPCALEEGKCCGGHNYGAAVIRFTSHFHAENARIMLAYDVYPYCGDGLDLVVTQNFVAAYRGRAVLLQQGFDQKPEAESFSNRRRVEWVRDIEAGDEIDFVLHPRGTHACDGMSVIDIIIWPAAASAA
ncbi:g10676 [Coccomyxa viridis]|uniref:G10676 protein n=1 Tax=Coccomyxa viridis TaxID=1274662 RepID=A0ABP1G5W7_9CHLO